MFSHSDLDGRLSGLGRGQSARVTALAAGGSMRRRLQDLGLIEGTTVECLGKSPLGDPCAYLIRGAVIALRRADADAIAVGPPAPPAQPEGLLRYRPTACRQVIDHGAF